jgi:hypothetical protein
MSRIFSKKRALIGIVASLAIVAVAVAYWTTTGTGTGTGTAGTDADNVSVSGTVTGLLTPGGPGRTVSFTAANPANFNQSISNIHLVSVDAYPTATDRTDGTNELAGCGGTNSGSSDFSMSDVPVTPSTDGDIAPGATAQVISASGTLSMNNLDSNQDACKDAFLKLTFTTS